MTHNIVNEIEKRRLCLTTLTGSRNRCTSLILYIPGGSATHGPARQFHVAPSPFPPLQLPHTDSRTTRQLEPRMVMAQTRSTPNRHCPASPYLNQNVFTPFCLLFVTVRDGFVTTRPAAAKGCRADPCFITYTVHLMSFAH